MRCPCLDVCARCDVLFGSVCVCVRACLAYVHVRHDRVVGSAVFAVFCCASSRDELPAWCCLSKFREDAECRGAWDAGQALARTRPVGQRQRRVMSSKRQKSPVFLRIDSLDGDNWSRVGSHLASPLMRQG